MHDLTQRQAEVFRLIYESARDLGVQPSFRDIAASIGTKSPHGVSWFIDALEKKGYVARPKDHQMSRSLRILRRPDGSRFEGFQDRPSENGPFRTPANEDRLLRLGGTLDRLGLLPPSSTKGK